MDILSYVVRDVRIDNNCMFSYTEVISSYYNERRQTQSRIFSLPLGAVSEVIGGHYGIPSNHNEDMLLGVQIMTGKMAAVLTNESSTYPTSRADIELARYPQALPGHEVPPEPAQMVPHIVSALQHAVSLCQSAYKAPAQTKELF
jgi:hypothetical protein